MISEDNFLRAFDRIFEHLPIDKKRVLKEAWGGNRPSITFDEKLIDSNPFGKVDIAAALPGMHFYRLRLIKKEIIVDVILEEIIHDYRFLQNPNEILVYRTGTDAERNRIEILTGRMVAEWRDQYLGCTKDTLLEDIHED